MSSPDSPGERSRGPALAEPEGGWSRGIGWLIDNRLVVLILTVLLVFGGLYVAPFDWNSAGLPRDPVPVDALPDIGDNQQIVFTEWAGRSPRDVEDQISYPLTSALLGIPGVRTVRSTSAFGFSTISVIFNDDIEFYWSRSRVLEKLSSLAPGSLPEGVTPTLGPDATALGQIFWYTLEGHDAEGNVVGGWDPDELRAIQDFSVRYALQAVSGVSEVASVGGFVREYQVDVDPEAMRAHGITLTQVAQAVQQSNLDVGARTLEVNGVEYMIRGLGLVEKLADLEASVVVSRDSTPIRIRDVAHVSLGPALRRGILDDEGAPAVGGVVVARYGENPLLVISALKEKIALIEPGLPQRTLEDGTVSRIRIVPFYDRTKLVGETLKTLSSSLLLEMLISVLIVLIMLRDLRSSLLISLTLPLGVLLTFVVMKLTGVDANVMALGGIAIAIGTMVDIGIVFVENMNQHLERLPEGGSRPRAIRAAASEVAPAVLTSVLTTVVSFLPVLGLSSSELRLFGPLALTKTFAMSGALLLSIVVLPGLAAFALRARPGPTLKGRRGSRSRRVAASVFRREHVRDWVLLVVGLLVLQLTLLGGLFVAALGAFRLARPLMPQRWITRGSALENALAVIAVTWLLAVEWLPLGHAAGTIKNLLFVGAVVLLLMGSFRLFEHFYSGILRELLRRKMLFLSAPLLVVLLGMLVLFGFDRLFGFVPQGLRTLRPVVAVADAFPGLGREYMPPFDEGSFLYMPSTMPHASIGEAQALISEMDAAIAQIPEVDRVVGKLGRADTALDPAPISMFETIITYKPEYVENAQGDPVRQWRDHIRSSQDIWDEIARAAERPGLTSAPTLMPISARIVMLQSGMRAPMGIKVHGPTLESLESFGLSLERLLKQVPQIRPETVFADRVVGKPYLEIVIDREAIGRFGLSIQDVQDTLQVALGGEMLTQSVEGRERYPIRVRYMREERDSLEALERIFVPTEQGAQIPLGQLATIRYVKGPMMIKSEDTFLTSYVLFDKQADIAELTAVHAAQQAIEQSLKAGKLVLPEGVSFAFAGSYQNQIRSEQRLSLLVPLALALVFILLYLQFHRTSVALVIYSGVAVAVAGGFILLWLYGQSWFLDVSLWGTNLRDLFQVRTVNLSVAAWIGFIALIGIATDDGVVISTYLSQQIAAAPPTTREEVRQRTVAAGSRRVRPCLMTTATTILALLPVISSQGRGSDIMVPMALPSVGGMLIALMTLFVVPVLYCALEESKLRSGRTPRDTSRLQP